MQWDLDLAHWFDSSRFGCPTSGQTGFHFSELASSLFTWVFFHHSFFRDISLNSQGRLFCFPLYFIQYSVDFIYLSCFKLSNLYSFIYSYIYSFIYSYIYIRLFIRIFIRLFIRIFLYSFVSPFLSCSAIIIFISCSC